MLCVVLHAFDTSVQKAEAGGGSSSNLARDPQRAPVAMLRENQLCDPEANCPQMPASAHLAHRSQKFPTVKRLLANTNASHPHRLEPCPWPEGRTTVPEGAESVGKNTGREGSRFLLREHWRPPASPGGLSPRDHKGASATRHCEDRYSFI